MVIFPKIGFGQQGYIASFHGGDYIMGGSELPGGTKTSYSMFSHPHSFSSIKPASSRHPPESVESAVPRKEEAQVHASAAVNSKPGKSTGGKEIPPG
jgi:hypothetical protein